MLHINRKKQELSLETFINKLLVMYSYLAVLLAFVLLPIYYLSGQIIVCYAIIFYTLIVIAELQYLKSSGSLTVASNIFTAALFILISFVMLVIDGKAVDSRSWILIFPLVALSLHGAKQGLVWSIIFAATIVLIFFLNNHYSLFSLLISLVAFGAAIVIIYMFRVYIEENLELLEKTSITDSLTQLYNRRQLNVMLESEFKRNQRDNKTMAIYILDLDHFKLYNDLYGHLQGDEALIKVSELMKTTFKRATDMVFRYGGEEFCIIVSDIDFVNAKKLAVKLQENLSSLNILHEKNEPKYITFSIGLVLEDFSRDITTQALLKQADNALYEAKEKGRNAIVSYSNSLK